MVPVPLGCGFSVVILDIFVVILVDLIIALSSDGFWQLFLSSNLWFLNGFSPKKGNVSCL